MNDWNFKIFFKIVLIAQLTMWVLTLLDIPLLRQVFGFLYLSFIPGIILLRILRIHGKSVIETVLFSVGLSIAFSMGAGLLVNELYSAVGISQPLSSRFLLPTFFSIVLILSVLVYFTDGGFSPCSVRKIDRPKLSLLLLFLPVISVLGAVLLAISGNNLISLLVVIFISGMVFLSAISEKVIGLRNYPVVIWVIAISLLFLFSFTSVYIVGFDVHLEYNVFKMVQTSSYWNTTAPSSNSVYSTYYDMLSITVLPAIYSSVLNMDGTWVFKILYPLILSLVPLGLYQVYQKEFGERTAFLSSLFFLSFNVFFDQMLGLNRQIVAELFLVLLVLLLIDRKMNRAQRIGLSMIFGAALVVSHYSVSYIFIFLILFVYTFSYRTNERNKTLTWYFILTFLAMAFSWYTFTSSSAPLVGAMDADKQIWRSISTEFFNLLSRSPEVKSALSIGSAASPMHEIGTIVFQTTALLIAVGFIKLTLRRKKMRIDLEYYLMVVAGFVLLCMAILLPSFASTIDMPRFYQIALIFLAPLFALGCDSLFGHIPKIKRFLPVLMAILLITFFLFQTGFIYETTQDIPSWGALSKYSVEPTTNYALYVEYTQVQDVFATQWLSRKTAGPPKVYSDRSSNYHVLTSYGELSPEYAYNWDFLLSNTTDHVDKGSYIYLDTLSVVYGLAEGPAAGILWNITDLSHLLNGCNRIYSDGGSSIYMAGNYGS